MLQTGGRSGSIDIGFRSDEPSFQNQDTHFAAESIRPRGAIVRLFVEDGKRKARLSVASCEGSYIAPQALCIVSSSRATIRNTAWVVSLRKKFLLIAFGLR